MPEQNLKRFIIWLFQKRNTEKKTIKRFNEAYLKLYEDGSIARILGAYNMKPVPIKDTIE